MNQIRYIFLYCVFFLVSFLLLSTSQSEINHSNNVVEPHSPRVNSNQYTIESGDKYLVSIPPHSKKGTTSHPLKEEEILNRMNHNIERLDKYSKHVKSRDEQVQVILTSLKEDVKTLQFHCNYGVESVAAIHPNKNVSLDGKESKQESKSYLFSDKNIFLLMIIIGAGLLIYLLRLIFKIKQDLFYSTLSKE